MGMFFSSDEIDQEYYDRIKKRRAKYGYQLDIFDVVVKALEGKESYDPEQQITIRLDQWLVSYKDRIFP